MAGAQKFAAVYPVTGLLPAIKKITSEGLILHDIKIGVSKNFSFLRRAGEIRHHHIRHQTFVNEANEIRHQTFKLLP